MFLSTLGVVFLFHSALMYEQHKFAIIYERSEVVSFNTSYIGFAKTHNFKYNRTKAVTNLTMEVKANLGNELQMEIQAYRLASNEYREFPVRFMFDYCQYAARNEFGIGEIFACGNSTACPFNKGIYRSCSWSVNATKFPPNIPGGSYMIDEKIFYHSVEILFFQAYATIKYPECQGCP